MKALHGEERLLPEAEQRVRREQIAYLYRFPHRTFGDIINGALIVVGMWGEVSPSIPLP